MSIRAYFNSLREKMIREPLPPEDIAAGWALGIFVGCAIPFGLQLIVSIPLAIMMRVSKVGATVATFITNPATIFVVYPLQTYLVDHFIFRGTLSLESLMDMEWTREAVFKLGAEVIASFFLGGILLAIVLTPISYVIVKRIVISHREKRLKKL